MEFEGTVYKILPVTKGTSARGKWQKFFYGNQITLLITRCFSCQFQVNFMFSRNDTDKISAFIAMQDKSLKHLLNVFS